jgi:hypothetical protein
MKWIGRQLVDSDGYPFVSITDATPQEAFDKFKAICDANMVEIESIMRQWKLARAKPALLTKTPPYLVRKEKLLNQWCRQAGIVDS